MIFYEWQSFELYNFARKFFGLKREENNAKPTKKQKKNKSWNIYRVMSVFFVCVQIDGHIMDEKVLL